VARDAYVRGVTVLVLSQVLDKSCPLLHQTLRTHGNVDDSDVIVLKKGLLKLATKEEFFFSKLKNLTKSRIMRAAELETHFHVGKGYFFPRSSKTTKCFKNNIGHY